MEVTRRYKWGIKRRMTSTFRILSASSSSTAPPGYLPGAFHIVADRAWKGGTRKRRAKFWYLINDGFQ